LTVEEIIIAIIGALAVVLSAIIPYVITKNKEIEVRIKEKKLERYDMLLSKFTKFLSDPPDTMYTYEFIEAYNSASAYASNEVLKACHDLMEAIKKQSEKRKTNPRYVIPDEEQDKLISGVFIAIRKDVRPKEPDFNFKAFKPIKPTKLPSES
jgi:hypothetical protein